MPQCVRLWPVAELFGDALCLDTKAAQVQMKPRVCRRAVIARQPRTTDKQGSNCILAASQTKRPRDQKKNAQSEVGCVKVSYILVGDSVCCDGGLQVSVGEASRVQPSPFDRDPCV